MPGYQESSTINGRNYTVSRLPFGIKNDPNSMRGCLALIGKILAVSSQESDDIIDIIAHIVSRSDSEEASKILSSLGERSQFCDGQKKFPLDEGFQNIHWSDYPKDFFPWLIFALKVNFEDFLSGGNDALGGLAQTAEDPAKAKKAQKLLKSLMKSTG